MTYQKRKNFNIIETHFCSTAGLYSIVRVRTSIEYFLINHIYQISREMALYRARRFLHRAIEMFIGIVYKLRPYYWLAKFSKMHIILTLDKVISLD